MGTDIYQAPYVLVTVLCMCSIVANTVLFLWEERKGNRGYGGPGRELIGG